MIQLKHASRGKQMSSLPAMFISDWYREKFNVLVDIPVGTEKALLVFSLQTELKKKEIFQKMSEKSYLTLIQVVSSALGALDDKAMRKAIAQSGLDFDNDAVTSILTEIRKEVTKQISGAGIASILVNDVLQAKMSKVEKIKDINFASIMDAITRVQDLYGAFASSASLAAVGEQIGSMFQSVSLIKHVHDVWVTMNRHKSATVKGRLTYALDKMYENTFGEEMLDMKTVISGMHYHVNDVKIVKDLKYRQVVCTYFVSLRALLGIETTEDNVAVKLSELLDHFLLHIPDQLPVLPQELSCTAKEIKDGQQVFARMWLMNVYQAILTHDEGTLAHQINNVMEDRKYTRNESWDGMIREGITISSIMFSAYVKTGAQFRDWARDEDIYFMEDRNLTHNVKLKLNKFVFDVVQGYNTLLSLEHTRFLHNPAHIVNYSESPRMGTDIQYFIPDKEMQFNKVQWMINEQTLERTLIYKNKIITGTDLDVEMDISRVLLPMSYNITPLLGFTLARPGIFAGDVSAAFLGIQSVEFLMSLTDIPGEILRASELVLIKDASDIAETFGISEEIAEMIFKGPGMYASLARQSTMFMTWDFETAPVVEFSAIDITKGYIPFCARYPYLLTYRNTLPSITGLPGALPPSVILPPTYNPALKGPKIDNSGTKVLEEGEKENYRSKNKIDASEDEKKPDEGKEEKK